MKQNLIIKDKASEEIIEAYNWYEKQRIGLGEELFEEINEAFFIILSQPELFQKTYKSYRQFVLRKFPYVIVFEVENLDIIIYSFFHTKLNPEKKYP